MKKFTEINYFTRQRGIEEGHCLRPHQQVRVLTLYAFHFTVFRQSNKLHHNRVLLQLNILLNFNEECCKTLPTVDFDRKQQSFTESLCITF
jgi:hypothetical protein